MAKKAPPTKQVTADIPGHWEIAAAIGRGLVASVADLSYEMRNGRWEQAGTVTVQGPGLDRTRTRTGEDAERTFAPGEPGHHIPDWLTDLIDEHRPRPDTD
ncbi:hypothetical protein [Streptomyces candidus]|uniref:Uncharacterized protein n=1 Tax=Streptomyces candidus TaxID=67283 RepID=A0A7X0HNF9_9ACTN|nr:hypothetical protein [Streptomyces candidus]MBB6439582.1 hypothetical protein [Streptomyces candidus]GHH54659.1 hypothetical protein GCM10018773_57960 [Streptomyces candidus]